MDRLKTYILHPFLIAAYIVLALFAHNIEEMQLSDTLRSLIVLLSGTCIVLLGLWALLKDWLKAAFITSLALILFFSYGHVYSALKLIQPLGKLIGRHRFLAPLWLGIFIFGTWLAARRKADLRLPTQALNIAAIVALVFPLFQSGSFMISDFSSALAQPEASGAHGAVEGQKPDIYYIILDAYGRDDILQRNFNFDNTPFLDRLADMGFYTARCSLSNYAQTQLSLASSLNMNYLQDIDEKYSGRTDNDKRAGLPKLIKNSAVRLYLEELGYTSIAFQTGFHWTQVTDADVYLTKNNAPLARLSLIGGITDFESLLIKSSAGLLLADGVISVPDFVNAELDYPEREHRERVLFILDQLENLARTPGPKFVFAHIVSPHPPFVFGPNGEVSIKDNEDMTGYIDQISYLNKRLEKLLDRIIAESDTPPVIVVQADHGILFSSFESRVAILNTYYLPGGGDQLLYESISPVNTFRLIFNYYLNGDYELLEDVSYFSNYLKPFDYEVVPSTRPGCER